MYIYFDESENKFKSTVSKVDIINFNWIEVDYGQVDRMVTKLEKLKDQCIPYWVVSVTDSYIAPAVERFWYLDENAAEDAYNDFEDDSTDDDGSNVEIKEYTNTPFSKVFHNFEENEILSL